MTSPDTHRRSIDGRRKKMETIMEPAHAQRLAQAGALLRSLLVIMPDGRKVPAFIERPDGTFVANPAGRPRARRRAK